jgi:hypothetical protein
MAIEIGPGWTIGGGISIVQPPPAGNKAIFGYGSTGTSVSMTNLVSSTTTTTIIN